MALSNRIVEALIGKSNTMPINVQSYIQNVGNENYAKNLTPDQIQGIAQGLNYGNKDVANMQQSLGIPIPKTPEELALARQGKFNYQGRTGGIIPDLGRGFQQNYNNNLVQSLGQPLQNPNLATTIGRGLGTLTRITDSPLGRSLLAAGAVKALGGTGGQALAQGLNAGVIRQDLSAQDKLYRNQLQQMGIDTSNIRGNINKDTFRNISEDYNKRQRMMMQQQIASAKDDTQRVRIITQALNNGIYSPEEANQLLKAYGLEGKTQQSNQTQITQAKKQDMKVRQGIAQQNANANTTRANAAMKRAESKNNTNNQPKTAQQNKKPLTLQERQQMIDAIKKYQKGKK